MISSLNLPVSIRTAEPLNSVWHCFFQPYDKLVPLYLGALKICWLTNLISSYRLPGNEFRLLQGISARPASASVRVRCATTTRARLASTAPAVLIGIPAAISIIRRTSKRRNAIVRRAIRPATVVPSARVLDVSKAAIRTAPTVACASMTSPRLVQSASVARCSTARNARTRVIRAASTAHVNILCL